MLLKVSWEVAKSLISGIRTTLLLESLFLVALKPMDNLQHKINNASKGQGAIITRNHTKAFTDRDKEKKKCKVINIQ